MGETHLVREVDEPVQKRVEHLLLGRCARSPVKQLADGRSVLRVGIIAAVDLKVGVVCHALEVEGQRDVAHVIAGEAEWLSRQVEPTRTKQR